MDVALNLWKILETLWRILIKCLIWWAGNYKHTKKNAQAEYLFHEVQIVFKVITSFQVPREISQRQQGQQRQQR